MKKPSLLARVLVPLGILVAILGVAAVCIALSPLGSMFGSMISVSRDHNSLKDRDDAHELGAVMASMLRNPALAADRVINGDDERMPAQLGELGASYISLNSTSGNAKLEFGGGFYHYGYEIQAEGEHRYRMVCYGETEEDVDDLGTFQYSQGEQDGARQPTTALDSKSEGNENPEPESEGRSQ